MKLKTAGSHQNKRKYTRWESGHGGVGPGGIAETASNAGVGVDLNSEAVTWRSEG